MTTEIQKLTPTEILAKLKEPFAENEIEWRPMNFSKDKTRATAAAYITARAVMDRLDDAVGPDNWEDEYEFNADGTVTCRLAVSFDGENFTTKQDVGGYTGEPFVKDQYGNVDELRGKGAVSDSLKRAAVKFGIGRYLYALPEQWVALDQYKKFAKQPTLPDWAKPGGKSLPVPAAVVASAHQQQAAAFGKPYEPEEVPEEIPF